MTLRVKSRKVSELKPYAKNPRAHFDVQIEKVVKSIKEFGWTNPILIDEKSRILAGHARWLAAKEMGLEDVPTITLEGMSEAQKRAYTIADNKLVEAGMWDNALLSDEIRALLEQDFDLSLTGFSDGEVDYLLSLGQGDGDDGAFKTDLQGFDTVAFSFGDYRAQIEIAVYERFKTLIEVSHNKEMIGDFLKELMAGNGNRRTKER